MPLMNGYQATEQIRNQSQYDDIPIIALTANAMQKDSDRAKEAGMQGYLSKPINVDFFYKLLLKHLSVKVDMSTQKPSVSQPNIVGTQLDGLYNIKEINIIEGIERVGGDVDLYTGVLFDFLDIFRDSASKLTNLIEVGANESAKELVHNIKGTAGNIGAEDICSIMEQLERLLEKSASIPVTLLVVERLGVVFSTLVSSLDKTRENIDKAKPKISKVYLDGLLSKIVKKAKRRKAIECKDLAIELEGYSWPDGYSDILNDIIILLKEYRFKEAVAKIEEMD